MKTKFCRDCGDYRPIADFSKNARSRDGLAFYCREHLAERSLRSREARRTKPRVRRIPPEGLPIPEGHKWCGGCGEAKSLSEFVKTPTSKTGIGSYCLPCHAERCRTTADKRGGYRTYHLSRRYGITGEEADHLLRLQNGLCAICQLAPASHVDHDHATGAVRQLLCFNCNGGLGQFKDDPEALRAAADYIERHRLRQKESRRRPVTPARAPRRPAMWRQFGMCRHGFSSLTRLEPGP
jgi:hypothetical protein